MVFCFIYKVNKYLQITGKPQRYLSHLYYIGLLYNEYMGVKAFVLHFQSANSISALQLFAEWGFPEGYQRESDQYPSATAAENAEPPTPTND